MSPHLRLISADLDAYEADQQARRSLATRYEIAFDNRDQLELARIEALAADYDARHPGETPVLDDVLNDIGRQYLTAA
ncbi:hypothetical protein [Streptomyces sp. NRRL F-5135]|uniref:hypothetical protein n=1 Tax=Streptomyces sp. NRRL F-5135 TaxID=1463858 RepID=UPI0004C850FE|nr:hypothetical protein [Streptomyces sp. NRRL F-5135]